MWIKMAAGRTLCIIPIRARSRSHEDFNSTSNNTPEIHWTSTYAAAFKAANVAPPLPPTNLRVTSVK